MIVEQVKDKQLLDSIINQDLKPFVKKIDANAYYAKEYLINLGRNGFFDSEGLDYKEVLEREAWLVGKTSEYCMTTGFNLWCHLAALTYLRHTDNDYLKSELLPKLEKGESLAGTGLSNPMKYFSGMEPLHLKAERKKGGYSINGNLGAVSNLDNDHWFGIIASLEDGREVMAFVPCNTNGLTRKERAEYIGLNGSATYACKFSNCFIPDEWVISEEAKNFCDIIRPIFVLYQIPLGLGVMQTAIQSMKRAPKKHGNINKFLEIQPEDMEIKYDKLKQRFVSLLEDNDLRGSITEILKLRLDTDYLTMQVVHGDMLHYGGAAYLQKSNPSRRLRESYFFLNLTPTLKHLEKVLSEND
jgi:hypothetical protein